ncbi:MAG: DUF1553 domain-containing protein, partial [Blastocatellia bacterium]
EAKRASLKKEIEAIEATMKADTPELAKAQATWEREILEAPAKWTALDPREYKSVGGATLTKQTDLSLLASGAAPEYDEYIIRVRAGLKKITGLRIEALPDASLPRGGPGRDLYGNFILTTMEVDANGTPLTFRDGGWDDGLSKFDGKVFFNREPMTQIADRPRGWLINAMNDEQRLMRQAVFALDKPLKADNPVDLLIRLKFNAGGLCQDIGRLRISATSDDDPLLITRVPAPLRVALPLPLEQRSAKQKSGLMTQFRNLTPKLQKERDRLDALKREQNRLGIITALVMGERQGGDGPATDVRERGNFMSRGERVRAGVPAVLPPLPDNQPVNRLALARWLVDAKNPLTARVAVNRFWEQFFGRGLVETSEDFGAQGQPPSHPELLDWLATEFRDGEKKTPAARWSMKALHRLIVTSAAYRQASEAAPALVEKDPYNRLLARGPRFRVEAEMIRDLMLTASGLLTTKIGGPSVMPPQPDGIWKNPYSSEKWATSTGENRYRRGVYTFIRRTSPYPAMMTFDATSRESCTVRRVRTNTPLQSLTLLNDEATFEMARALARRMLTETSGDGRARLEHGFRLCMTRRPSAAELGRLEKLFQDELAYYRQNPGEASRVTKDGFANLSNTKDVDGAQQAARHAAWTLVANVLLNLDETLTKQ